MGKASLSNYWLFGHLDKALQGVDFFSFCDHNILETAD